jgi:hypothetical protein
MHGPHCKEIIYITDTEVSPVRSSRRALQSGNSAGNSATFESQLSNFGLAKWAPRSASHIKCNDVVGTFG